MTKEEKDAYILGWYDGVRYLGIDLENYELRTYFQKCKTLEEKNLAIQKRVKLAQKECKVIVDEEG